MVLIAGMGVGFWLVVDEVKDMLSGICVVGPLPYGRWDFAAATCVGFGLGGLSAIGPPLLLSQRPRKPWDVGRTLWFTYGSAVWILWVPLVAVRLSGGNPLRSLASGDIFLCVLPMMSTFLGPALIAGGWLRRARRHRMLRSWHEFTGLLLGGSWGCLGLYFLMLFLWDDILVLSR